MVVVPDSIEPAIGVKWLYVRDVGVLYSQNGYTPWPNDAPLQAVCARDWGSHWVPIRDGVPNPRVEENSQFEQNQVASPRGWITRPGEPRREYTTDDPYAMPDEMRFKIALPSGLQWSWEPRECPHEAPDMACSCGIYIADDASQCEHYRRFASVLVKVAVWGHIVRHTGGARGQFGYPLDIVDVNEIPDGTVAAVRKHYRLDVPTPFVPPEPEQEPEEPEGDKRSTPIRDFLGL